MVNHHLNYAQKTAASAFKVSPADVYVTSVRKGLMREQMQLARVLWERGVRADLAYKASNNTKLAQQRAHCERYGIPWMLIVGYAYSKLVRVRTLERFDVQNETEALIAAILEKLREDDDETNMKRAQTDGNAENGARKHEDQEEVNSSA